MSGEEDGTMAADGFTLRPTAGGVAFGAIGSVVCVVFGLSLVSGGGLTTALGVLSLVLAPIVVAQTILVSARVSGDELTVSNGLRRRTFTRSDILSFDVPISFVKGGNAISVIPAVGGPMRIHATGRSMASFADIGRMGDRLNAWLYSRPTPRASNSDQVV